jgi:hypothetical protein
MPWVGPGPSDELAVPAQERRRRDEEGCPPLPAEQTASVARTARSAGE